MKEHSRTIIVGKSGSGKTTLKNLLISRGFTPEVSFTTRQIRHGETGGIDYHFVTREYFEYRISQNQLIQYTEYNGNYYGTAVWQWHTNDVFIMTPSGLSKLSEIDRKKSFVIYLNPPEQILRNRLYERFGDEKKVADRILADSLEFENISFDIEIPHFIIGS